ncbi:MAG: outer membrane beta-barrel protein [Rikenellaceae bacterium]
MNSSTKPTTDIMHKFLALLLALVISTAATDSTIAQNIIGVTGGIGSSTINVYPTQETKSSYGMQNYGFTWRNYSAERFVGGVGADIEYMQRGFKYSPSLITTESGEEYYYYSRQINTIMVPIVWQPHAYIIHRKVRVFAEAAVTFSYDVSSTWENDYAREIYESEGIIGGSTEFSGDYEFKTERDNRFGYGLAGGGGLSLLMGDRLELLARARYYYGLSDVLRNRNKYYTNNMDGLENPFTLTPLRSNLHSFSISVGLCVHLGRKGFAAWDVKPRKRDKSSREFNYEGNIEVPLDGKGNGEQQRPQQQHQQQREK